MLVRTASSSKRSALALLLYVDGSGSGYKPALIKAFSRVARTMASHALSSSAIGGAEANSGATRLHSNAVDSPSPSRSWRSLSKGAKREPTSLSLFLASGATIVCQQKPVFYTDPQTEHLREVFRIKRYSPRMSRFSSIGHVSRRVPEASRRLPSESIAALRYRFSHSAAKSL